MTSNSSDRSIFPYKRHVHVLSGILASLLVLLNFIVKFFLEKVVAYKSDQINELLGRRAWGISSTSRFLSQNLYTAFTHSALCHCSAYNYDCNGSDAIY